MQKHVNLVDLVKSFPTNIYLQNLASIQKRTSPVKFANLAEKSGKGSISNLSTKVPGRCPRAEPGGGSGPQELESPFCSHARDCASIREYKLLLVVRLRKCIHQSGHEELRVSPLNEAFGANLNTRRKYSSGDCYLKPRMPTTR